MDSPSLDSLSPDLPPFSFLCAAGRLLLLQDSCSTASDQPQESYRTATGQTKAPAVKLNRNRISALRSQIPSKFLRLACWLLVYMYKSKFHSHARNLNRS